MDDEYFLQEIDADGGLLEVCATYDGIDRVDRAITEYFSERGPDLDLFIVRLLIREAVLNAVMHGCANDASQRVKVYFEIGQEQVDFTVEDPGPGFDWKKHETEGEDDLKVGRRGVDLMFQCAERVEFNDTGNRVTFSCAIATDREREPEQEQA